MKMDILWDESLGHRLKVERGMIVDADQSWNQTRSRDKRERSQSNDRNLNFSTISNEEDEFGFSRKKTARDPMSHRIIEKRRRDRMNNCLADLSRLVPTNYLKKGRGRIEKTEIIEMAIKHLKHLQAHPCKDPGTCEVAKSTENDHKRQYRLGFQECLSEAVRFLVEMEGLYAGDGLCVRLVNHLQTHFDKLNGGMCYSRALSMLSSEVSKIVPMDVEHPVHGVQLENYHESATVIAESGHSNDIRSVDGFPNVLKHEKDYSSNSANGVFNDSSEYALSNGASVVRVASQLREMLQNPGLPKDQSLSRASPNATITHPTVLVCDSQDQGRSGSPNLKNEEVYKFKNNIKHRFNADLRHQTASPTDSHSDYISLPDDDMRTHNDTPKNRSGAHQNENYPSTSCHNGHSDGNHINGSHTNGNHTNGNHTNGHHTNGHHHPQRPFSPYPAVAELSVKIPERTANDTHHQHHSGHWETGSSCGSNPSTTPPVARSNGSSSGYSTNGELPIGTKPKIVHGGHQHSPNVSPYSRTPDHVLNRSPSPQNSASQVTTQAVPIFALHPKGTFYIPLTIDSGYLAPYILGLEDLAPVLHPVSICVNFSLCHSSALKADKLNGNSLQVRGPPQFLDRMNDRFAYGERLRF